jgi:hypothetical protein
MIIPLEVQKANKNKPIPYGLWDTYRERYSWRPVFVIPDEGKMNERVRMEMINGEVETPVYEIFQNNEYNQRAIPKRLLFGWWDKNGQGYSGIVNFDEKEMADAFEAVYKDHRETNIEIEIRVNKMNSFFTVRLKGNGKEIPVYEKNKIDVYKSEGLTKKYKKQ